MENDFLIFLGIYFFSLTYTILLDMGFSSKQVVIYILSFLVIIIIFFGTLFILSYYNYMSEFVFNSNNITDDDIKKMQVFGLKGDFIGGVFGTFFTILAVFLSAIGIILAVWNNNKQIETQREIAELNQFNIKCQNKPFLYVNFELVGKVAFHVTLNNLGIGPLEFKYIKLVSDENEFNNNFFEHYTSVMGGFDLSDYIITKDFHSDPKIILGIGDSKRICYYGVNLVSNIEMLKPLKYYLNSLSKYKLECCYIDIFDNEYFYNKDMSFLNERYNLN